MTAIHQTVEIPNDRKLHLDIDVPADLPLGTAEVTVSISPKRTPDMDKAVEALNKLQELGGLQCFGDPAEWQREERKDRPLPGRE
jgi:hypothetical protein